MSFCYVQRTGSLYDPYGRRLGLGYSGHGSGLNNPAMQATHAVGPIPTGLWRVGEPYDDPHLGPCVMHLDPAEGTDALGRSLFRIHGDNSRMNHSASDGCVVLGRGLRRIVADSEDGDLLVVAEENDVKGTP